MVGGWDSGYSREGVGFAANRPMMIHAAPFSPSFLWKEEEKGAAVSRVKRYSFIREPTPPRFARLPLPEEGARMIFKETLIQSLLFAVRVSRFPHICCALLRFPHLSFMPPVPYPPLRGHLPLEGKADGTGIASSKKATKPPPYNKAPSTSVGMTFKKDG